MAFALTIAFRGQCALAPKSGGGEAKIFMPNLTRAGEDPELMNHFGALRFDARYLVPEGTPNEPSGAVILTLTQQNVRITAPAGAPARSLDVVGLDKIEGSNEPSLVRRPIAEEVGKDGSEEFGIYWLAALERACSGRGLTQGGGVLERSFLSDVLDKEFASELSARIELSRGQLFVARFLDDPKTPDAHVVWRFRGALDEARGGDHLQILASEFTLQDSIDDIALTLELRALADKTNLQIIRLYPRSGQMSLVAQNEEAEQFVGVPIVEGVSLKRPRSRDKIFAGFFRLAFNPPPPDERPLPVADYFVSKPAADPDGEDEPAQSAPPCSPSRFEPYAL